MTEIPSGDWLCPRCNYKSTKDAALLEKRREVKMSMLPKLGKTAATGVKDSMNRQRKGVKAAADKKTRPAKKGMAIKKVAPKKKPRWVELIETTSEDEDKPEESVDAAQKAENVTDGSRAKGRATRSQRRLKKLGTLKRSSKLAVGGKKKAKIELEEDLMEIDDGELSDGRKERDGYPYNVTEKSDRELFGIPEDLDGVKPDHTADGSGADPDNPHNARQFLEPAPRLPRETPKNAVGASNHPPKVSAEATYPTTPAIGSQAMHSPPGALLYSSQDAITVRHPSDVPSTPPAGGAATVIDTEETPTITSVTPDGSSSVDYWSYRQNTSCKIPLSAMRSTLPRLR